MQNTAQKTKEKHKESNGFCLIGLYKKGKLGRFPVAERRLQAGMAFANDFRASLFSHRTTLNYDRLFTTRGGRGKTEASDFRCDATDRYFNALKAVEPYGVYALHFLRDERNIAAFLDRYPVLNKGSRRTYGMVYKAINAMLDKLADFYDRVEKR